MKDFERSYFSDFTSGGEAMNMESSSGPTDFLLTICTPKETLERTEPVLIFPLFVREYFIAYNHMRPPPRWWNGMYLF